MVLHRNLSSTYTGNYRYGSALYDTSMGDAEKIYRDTLAKTPVRKDRGDLGLYSFLGSHVHGGTPAVGHPISNLPAAPAPNRSTTNNLYEPLSFGYGRNYYNHLRADYQKPKAKPARSPRSADLYDVTADTLSGSASATASAAVAAAASGADLKTHSAKTTTSYDDAKKTVTTTTTTERWVPLTSYLYPSHYYHYSSGPYTTTSTRVGNTIDDTYYSDDYYKSTTTTSKSRNIDALDLNVSSYSMDKLDYNNWMSKCHDIQTHLDQVNSWIADADAKIKTDVVGARNKMQNELTELTLVADDTARYNEELQKVIKKQARQIIDLHSQQDDINRHLVDVSDNLEKSRVRCQTMQGELTGVQTSLDLAMRRK